MIYSDTSSLLKWMITARFSTFVELAIASEPVVIVSSSGFAKGRIATRHEKRDRRVAPVPYKQSIRIKRGGV